MFLKKLHNTLKLLYEVLISEIKKMHLQLLTTPYLFCVGKNNYNRLVLVGIANLNISASLYRRPIRR